MSDHVDPKYLSESSPFCMSNLVLDAPRPILPFPGLHFLHSHWLCFVDASAMKAAQGNSGVNPKPGMPAFPAYPITDSLCSIDNFGPAHTPAKKMTYDQASEICGLMASVMDDHSPDHALDDTVDIIAQRCAAAIEWIQAEILTDETKSV
eukprot:766321-Hanusia_phi.AAC.3